MHVSSYSCLVPHTLVTHVEMNYSLGLLLNTSTSSPVRSPFIACCLSCSLPCVVLPRASSYYPVCDLVLSGAIVWSLVLSGATMGCLVLSRPTVGSLVLSCLSAYILCRVLHAHDLVGDSVEDMLVLLTSDAFQPPGNNNENEGGATGASCSTSSSSVRDV